MKHIRLTASSAVRRQPEAWAEFESKARELVTVEDSGLGVMTILVDAESDTDVLVALRPLEREAGHLGISELRVTGDRVGFVLGPVAS